MKLVKIPASHLPIAREAVSGKAQLVQVGLLNGGTMQLNTNWAASNPQYTPPSTKSQKVYGFTSIVLAIFLNGVV